MSKEVETVETDPQETSNDTTSDDGNVEAAEKPKKKSKARLIILVLVIVVALMFATGGVVYATQHSNPDFCDAVCHSPMSPYVTSFKEGISVNELQTDLEIPLLVTVHRDSDEAVVCVDCHTDGLDVTIAEGFSWLTKSYPTPLNPLVMTVKDPDGANQRSGVTTCLSGGCHEGLLTLDDLKQSTAHLERNVHDSHLGDQDCSSCHQMHQQSLVSCTQCHGETSRDGWLTFTERSRQIKELEALNAA
ncbi:MAG: cytochrome c3 family protein [Coriobacteriia bacterium]|nr:cytochrome c3 family protein [Coriobacteriia bacterium]